MLSQQINQRFLPVFAGIFCAVLVLIPSLASKFIAIGPFNVNGSIVLFPITFIFNDILTEVYGFARSRKIIWTGLGCQIMAALAYWIVGMGPSAPFWDNQEAFLSILGVAPRIVLASLTAYFFGEFANSLVLSKMKYWAEGKRGLQQSWRYVASTIVGEGIDSVIFMTVGFAGVLATHDIVTTILTIWIVKVLYEVAALPISTRVANYVKRAEGVDAIDSPLETNYSPFAVN